MDRDEAIPAIRARVRRHLLWLAPTLAGAIVVALAITLVAMKTHDGRPHARVGDILDYPFQEDPLKHAGTVTVPWAHLRVAAGKPRDELPELLNTDANLQAPDGGSFVPVEVSLIDRLDAVMTGTSYVEKSAVVLRADGHDYPLTGPGGLDLDPSAFASPLGRRWVAVMGTPTKLEIRITVDGVTQTVDAATGKVQAGRAAALAAIPSREKLSRDKPVTCGHLKRTEPGSLRVDYPDHPKCAVQASLRTPYVDGLGWARPGREFLDVEIVHDSLFEVSSGHGAKTSYWHNEHHLTATLAGQRARSITSIGLANRGDAEQVIFDVPAGTPAGTLTVRMEITARPKDLFVTRQRHLRLTWTVPGGSLA